MTQPYQLSPVPLFRAQDNNNRPLAGGQVFTYAAGTSTPQASYPSPTSGTPNPNPVVLNARGEAPIWLDPALTYKINVMDGLGNQIPGYPVDNIPGGFLFTQQAIGKVLFPQTSAEINAGITPTNYAYPAGNIIRYGGDPTGITDSTVAFASACSVALATSGSGIVQLPAGIFSTTTGFVAPNGTMVIGASTYPASISGAPPVFGTVLQCALTVAACLTIGDATANLPQGIKQCSITRASGTPPAGSIGLYMKGGSNVVINEILCYNHAQPFVALSQTGGGGISLHVQELFTGLASDADIVINSWPEAYFFNCRIGMNGGLNNVVHNCMVRYTGGEVNGGPNTTQFTGCHLNCASNLPTHVCEFVNWTTNTGPQEFIFVGTHVEGASGAYFFSDSTVTNLLALQIRSSYLNQPGIPVFSLNSASQPQRMAVTDSTVIASDLTLAASSQINSLIIADNFLNCNLSITGVGSSAVSIDGNICTGNTTIAGAFASLILRGLSGGSLTYSATVTSTIELGGDYARGTWTPAVTFGGSSTGVTYTTRLGSFWVDGNRVHGEFKLVFTGSGLTSGNAMIGGLPYAVSSVSGGGGGYLTAAAGLASLTSPVTLSENNAASTMNLLQWGATGIANVTNTNMGVSTITLLGVIDYEWAP